eukprot:8892697-Pyramimonas_sp.AAC.1
MAPEVQKLGAPLGSRPSLDRLTGWDSSDPEQVQELWRLLKKEEPDFVWLCPECGIFSAIN